MSSKDIEVLKKMRNHIAQILKYSKTCKEYDDFKSSDIIVDACVFNLMQIGELAKSELSEEAKTTITNIPWKKIYGMRNRIVHGYSYVDMRIIWDTIMDDLPKLTDELESFI